MIFELNNIKKRTDILNVTVRICQTFMYNLIPFCITAWGQLESITDLCTIKNTDCL